MPWLEGHLGRGMVRGSKLTSLRVGFEAVSVESCELSSPVVSGTGMSRGGHGGLWRLVVTLVMVLPKHGLLKRSGVAVDPSSGMDTRKLGSLVHEGIKPLLSLGVGGSGAEALLRGEKLVTAHVQEATSQRSEMREELTPAWLAPEFPRRSWR